MYLLALVSLLLCPLVSYARPPLGIFRALSGLSWDQFWASGGPFWGPLLGRAAPRGVLLGPLLGRPWPAPAPIGALLGALGPLLAAKDDFPRHLRKFTLIGEN